jgi:methionyl-tRNA formyltransferase
VSTVFLGTSEFAAAILERLAAEPAHRPALVITRPDRPSGRGRRLSAPPVAASARALGISLEQPDSVNDPGFSETIARRAGPAAVLIVCAFGALIKEPLLSAYEILNVHPSLLPRWRGAAPIERAIMAGDQQTGVSIMRLSAGLDSGPVCLQAAEEIRGNDSFQSLSARLQELGGELLLRSLQESPAFVEQAEEGVSYAEKILPADRLLDPGRPAIELDRRVRALHPHIGARVALADGGMLGVHRAALLPEASLGGPGDDEGDAGRAEPDHPSESDRLSERDGRLLLSANPGTLELLEVQPPGGRAMEASAYLRGHGLPGRR